MENTVPYRNHSTLRVLLLAIMLVLLPSAIPGSLQAQEVSLNGMIAGWATGNYSDRFNAQAGFRYLPRLTGEYQINENFSLDGKASANIYGSGTTWARDSLTLDSRLKPYRMWIRFSGNQFEVRAGLQKINFGSASMFRPLMWFDQIDPRDPLQLTDGVYALLGRYYFSNNANIWLWGLYGNDMRKGWEIFPSNKNKIEYGGRFQYPVLTGELALSAHHRKADLSQPLLPVMVNGSDAVSENRVALDGKFDAVAGLWFEGVLTHQDLETRAYKRALNLGADYTFALGNGLNVMAEHLLYNIADGLADQGDGTSFTALSVNYPFSIFTRINGILFYDWANDEFYNFINWSWQFDRWSFFIMGYWNPKRFALPQQNYEGTNLFAGQGIQLMFVFNH